MQANAWKYWAAAGLSAGLLELPFPLAGPLPPWRSMVAWIGLAPLIWAVMRVAGEGRRPLRRGFLIAYLCGFLWYMGNCYWVRDTMSLYGGMPPMAPTLLLIGFSLVLGLYFGLFGLGLALVRRRLGAVWALAAAPFLWVALELAGARITSVPWDQLGYSQVDNAVLTQLAPWTGVYGISFVLVAANALLACGLVLRVRTWRIWSAAGGVALTALAAVGLLMQTPRPAPTATAVLVQPNLDVASDYDWAPAEWDRHIADFTRLAGEQCKQYIAGIPQTGAAAGEVVCPPYTAHPDLIAWPESPTPFAEGDLKFQKMVAALAQQEGAPVVVGGIGMDYSDEERRWKEFNSAIVVGADGKKIGRYDKIHLVPFGEFVPYEKLLFFAKKLTGRVSKFDRGTDRTAFRIVDQNGVVRRYGVFICYEAVFADEIRHFARNGAEVLVNLSDDGWYGDTSAPWQHLNMARMRAIENRRWILRDTNNGVTAAIDPYGRVRQSIPRHQVDALPAQFGFRDDVTFYTEYGDVFAWVCAVVILSALAWAFSKRRSQSDV
ncbi:MAG TPA: apolipoprotein N-acyltransferase [Terracidiphilus sp.]|jgi:apolipoprotein N-acyltransferase|nr:apolipoprotein N-acyltransferase [Terracidiphilus sp.]